MKRHLALCETNCSTSARLLLKTIRPNDIIYINLKDGQSAKKWREIVEPNSDTFYHILLTRPFLSNPNLLKIAAIFVKAQVNFYLIDIHGQNMRMNRQERKLVSLCHGRKCNVWRFSNVSGTNARSVTNQQVKRIAKGHMNKLHL